MSFLASPTPENLAEAWQSFLAFLQKEEGGPLYAKLARANLTDLSDQNLIITGDRTLHFNGTHQKTRVQDLVGKFFGPQYQLQIEIKAPAPPKKAARREKKTFDMATLKQQALEVFGGQWLSPDKKEDSE